MDVWRSDQREQKGELLYLILKMVKSDAIYDSWEYR